MLKMTAKEVINAFKGYDPDEPVLIGWWDKETFESVFIDEKVNSGDVPDVWEEVTDDLDCGFDFENQSVWNSIADKVAEIAKEKEKN